LSWSSLLMATLWIPFLDDIIGISMHVFLGVTWFTHSSSPVTMYCGNCYPWLEPHAKCMKERPHTMSFATEVVWYPACTHFSVTQLWTMLAVLSSQQDV
jgi:hypothetical protein